MRTHLGHIEFRVRKENLGFYREVMAFLGWPTVYEDENMLGVGGTANDSLWFGAFETKDVRNDHDGPGMNHLGIGADSIADVDTVCGWLKEKGIAALFETPRHRPEFASDENSTYYQVMFASPDDILFEVVYTGPK